MTLDRRLHRCLGKKLALEAPGFSSEIGRLQKVLPRFIVVTDQFFRQKNLDKIIIVQTCTSLPACHVVIRTTFEQAIQARLVQIGLDFVEAIEVSTFCRRRVIIPLGRVVSIETVKIEAPAKRRRLRPYYHWLKQNISSLPFLGRGAGSSAG